MKELAFTIKSGFNTYDLVHSPDGWDDTVLNVERSTKFMGIVRTYAIQLKFVLEGATLLREKFYNKVPDDVQLIVKKLNRISLQYEEVFIGLFDFSTFADTDHFVEISIIDNSFANLVKRNLDKEYTVSFVSAENFYHIYQSNPVKPTKYVHFFRILRNLLDMAVEGRLNSGEFILDDSVIVTSSDIKRVITNSTALQGGDFTTINISLKDLFQCLYVLFKVVPSFQIIDGVQTMTLKTINQNFPVDVAMELLQVKDFKLSIAKEFLFDSIAIGYPDQDGETLEKSEFGFTSKYSNKSSMIVNNELDLTIKLRADISGIKEFSEQYGYPDDSINEPFVMVIRYDDGLNKYIVDENWVAHIYAIWQNAPNVRITPKRLLLEHEEFINSSFYGLDQEGMMSVYFLSGPGLIRQIGTKLLDSTADEQVEGIGFVRTKSPLFLPVVFDFEAILPDTITYNGISYPFTFNYLSIPELLRMSFDYDGTTYNGFLLSMKANVTGRKNKAIVRLLASPSTDLSKLIR